MYGKKGDAALRLGVVVIFVAVLGASSLALDHVGTPLNDLGPGTWKDYQGGLYPGGSNQKPFAWETTAIDIGTSQVQPLDASGDPNEASGKIGMISVGVSNTRMEFSVFVTNANSDPAKNPKLQIVNCAQDSMDTARWVNLSDTVWDVALSLIAAQGLTPEQVQVIWMKHAHMGAYNSSPFPTGPGLFRDDLQTISRNLKTTFVNARIIYMSSRTRAHTDVAGTLNPEPFAYETAWGVKWMIENQINGLGNLNWDPGQGTVVAPFIVWGPYLWADGPNPRSDGFVWLESDVMSNDLVHPSPSGRAKVAAQLLAFFKTDPSATPWFLRSNVVGQAPTAFITADAIVGPTGMAVQFTSHADDPDGTIIDYQWTYDDGCFSTDANPVKSFPAPGEYKVHLTVTDNEGNTAKATKLISVATGRPTGKFTHDFTYAMAPAAVNFDASSSVQGDFPIVSYDWDFGDGNTASGQMASHTFESNGDYFVTLTVTDSDSKTGAAEALIHVGPLDVSEIGDLRGNEVVDLEDYVELSKWWSTGELTADIVSDGIIDNRDLGVMCDNWLSGILYPHTEPIAWYKLNDGGGTLAVDSSGNGSTAFVSGAAWVTGREGGAVQFDGLDDIVVIPDTAEYDLPSGTWSLWIRTNGVWGTDGDSGGGGQGSAAIMARHNASASRAGIGLLIVPPASGGYLQAQVKNASTTVCNVLGTRNVITGVTWHHVAVVYNKTAGGQIALYIDGTPENSGTNSAAWEFEYQNINLADSPDNLFWEEFKGEIDDVQVYNRALSPTEIQWLCNNPGSSL